MKWSKQLIIWDFFSLSWTVTKTLVSSSSSTKEGRFRVNFCFKITHLTLFLFPFYWNKWFSHLFRFFLSWFRRLSATLFCSSSLCGVFLSSLFRSGICSVQIVISASIRCRSNQWLWCHQCCRSGGISISDTWI